MNKVLSFISLIIAVLGVLLCDYAVGLLKENKQLYTNIQLLNTQTNNYKTKDSLNAVKISDLELRITDYEKVNYRDRELIRSLQVDNKKLHQVVSTATQTIEELKGTVRDTIIYKVDTVIQSKAITVNQPWIKMSGTITDDTFNGNLTIIDSLVLTEQVTYERFLKVLWKTKRVKHREFDIVSKNPNTHIQDFQVITIEH